MMMKIVVTRLDGARIGLNEALMRHSVDAIFGLIAGIGMLVAVLQTEPTIFNSEIGWIDRNKLITNNTPSFASAAGMLSIAWGYSELIVLLFNKKRRAIHDFIAGTVVVHLEMANKEDAPDQEAVR
jgi:uncharacterized RDD family membrane protein YckC